MKKVSFYVSNWMSGVDICKLKRNIGDKKVYVLNDDKDFEYIREFLCEKGIEVSGFINLEEVEKQEDKPYLIVRSAYDNEMMIKLRSFGYYGEK